MCKKQETTVENVATGTGANAATQNPANGSKPVSRKKKSTIYIAFLAMFVALSTVMNIVSIPIADNSIQISFTYIPIVLAGAFMGPIAGLATGIIGDVLGCIIRPMGAWIPFITISNGVMGLIAGLIFKFVKINSFAKLAITMMLVFAICTCGITTYGLYITYSQGSKTFLAYLLGRIGLQLATFVGNTVLIFALYPALTKIVFRHRFIQSSTKKQAK